MYAARRVAPLEAAQWTFEAVRVGLSIVQATVPTPFVYKCCSGNVHLGIGRPIIIFVFVVVIAVLVNVFP